MGAGGGFGGASDGGTPLWAQGLTPWQWHEIPNTPLSSVDPAVRPYGGTGPRSKISTWCGATLKRRGSVYMLGAAGGHGDYAGNEVDALVLSDDAPHWVELRGPSQNADIINATQFYLDLRPSSTHTYYATQFIEPLDRMIVFASPGVSGPFPDPPMNFAYVGDKRSYAFELSTNEWMHPDAIAQYPGTGDFTACLVAKHPVTQEVYYSRNYGSGWYRYTPSANSWTKVNDNGRNPWYSAAAIDPVRNRMLVVGGYTPAAPDVLDLQGNSLHVTFGGLGASELTIGGYPGAIFDEAHDAFLVFFNKDGQVNVLRVNAETWAVDRPITVGPHPGARDNGIQNSPQYVPELHGVVLANRYDGNVFFLPLGP